MTNGIMSTGIGASEFALVSIIGGYLSSSIGWRASYLVLALFFVCAYTINVIGDWNKTIGSGSLS
jgi:hypothetical protein